MSRGEKVGAVLWVAMFGGVGLAFLVIGASKFVRGFSALDTSRSCTGSSACIVRIPALVTGPSVVSYDDGRRHATIEFRSGDPALPELGADVVLERWHGRNIGVFDPRSEQLHKSVNWPERWDDNALSMAVFGALFVAFTIFFQIGMFRSEKKEAVAG